jgi:hypothetical protein
MGQGEQSYLRAARPWRNIAAKNRVNADAWGGVPGGASRQTILSSERRTLERGKGRGEGGQVHGQISRRRGDQGQEFAEAVDWCPGGGKAARLANRRSREARPGKGKGPGKRREEGPGEGREKGPEQGEGNDESSCKGLKDD